MNKPLTFKNLLPFIIISFVLVLGPLAFAWLQTPPGYVFTGALANNNDFSAYLAAMRQGSEGKWLFHFTFSPEIWQPQYMLPMYMMVGKIASHSWNNAAWLVVLRVLALGATLLMSAAWVKLIFPNMLPKQWSAWLMLVFGGGLGWLLFPLANSIGVSDAVRYFPDIFDSGWTIGLIGANAPHYLFGLFLETLFFYCFWEMTQSAKWEWVWAASISAFLLGSIYVYNSVVLFAVVGLYLTWDVWEKRTISLKTWVRSGLTATPLLPLLFYYGYWINRDPTWAQYVTSAPNHIPPPTWYALLWGAGIVGFLAILGLQHWWSSKQNKLLIFWMLGNLLALYLPIVPYSGRFLLGLWIPLATLAANGLEEVVLPFLKKKHFTQVLKTSYESLRRMALILTMPSSLLVMFLFIKNISLQRDFPFYIPQGEARAMEWLASQTDPETDLVLAYYPIGNYFPILSDTRVFMGQFFLTVDFHTKESLVEKFWQSATSDVWRQALVDEWRITYIYQGVYENALSEGNINPPGTLVYDQAGVRIYQISD